jgi:hypothetical protein
MRPQGVLLDNPNLRVRQDFHHCDRYLLGVDPSEVLGRQEDGLLRGVGVGGPPGMRDAEAREHGTNVFAGPSAQRLISHPNILPDHPSASER